MTICQYIVAVVGTVAGTTNLAAQRAAIAFVCLYIFFFASSWGPVAWVVTGEIFPLKVRAKALSITTATNWYVSPPAFTPSNFLPRRATRQNEDISEARTGERLGFLERQFG